MILSRERTLDLSGSPLPKGQTSQSEADGQGANAQGLT